MLQPIRLGRYLLTRKIATGGMAEIFLAKLTGAEGFEKEIVIKKILPHWSQDRDFISMLIDEAKISVQLTHPNIIQVHELAREREHYYLAMEYVDGVDLRKLIRKAAESKKRIPLDVGLMIMTEMLEGLAFAHHKKDAKGRPLGIVHRDVSPQNILVSFDGSVKVTDFGIAKAASRSHETVTGVLKGKFAYMSPEQANQEDLDGRSDLFSAAVVLYELLSGDRLFYRNSDVDTLDRVRRGHVVFSAEAEKFLPVKLKEILLKALSRDPAGRHQDALEFRDALLGFARRSKKTLRREKVVSFLQGLYAEELQSREEPALEGFEATEVLRDPELPGATSLLEVTEKTEKEVLVQRPEEGTVLMTPGDSMPARESLWRELESIRGLRWILGSLGLVAVAAVFFIFSKPAHVARIDLVPPEILPSPVPPEFVSETSPAVFPENEKAEAVIEVIREEVPEPAPSPARTEIQGEATLSVQAIPWGYVTVDQGGRRETPLRKLPLKAGKHVVRVFYEPEGKTLSASIRLKDRQNMVCVADFREGKGMQCHP